MPSVENQLHALQKAIRHQLDVPLDALCVMPTSGLAHDHVTIEGTDWLLRVPRQSQMRLNAAENLTYQKTCFDRMSASGHTPECRLFIPPSDELPMGALLVRRIHGEVLQLPRQLELAAEALAAIHALPLPEHSQRAPLIDQSDPMADTLTEVLTQADYLPQAQLPTDTVKMIEEEIAAAKKDVAQLAVSPIALVSFDAHPGNFIVEQDTQRAYLVDLEKGRYGGAGFDLAHASLYTSTTWDTATYAELSSDDIQNFYAAWSDAMPPALSAQWQLYLLPMRRLMWLWSITWCAKWQVESNQQLKASKNIIANAEDWSAENTDDALIEHVRNRVIHYLEPATVERVRADWAG